MAEVSQDTVLLAYFQHILNANSIASDFSYGQELEEGIEMVSTENRSLGLRKVTILLRRFLVGCATAA